ncbi:MAG: DUF1343 domain-containing protein [Candidatus Marinimicrobia bacterium]|nr:DUF1343 domain-containing protein [Candidatus Neomarinimicrobiota bacterium]
MYNKKIIVILLTALLLLSCSAKSGLDIATKNGFPMLKGKAVGVVANHTAKNADGEHIVDLMHDSGIKIQAIFGPEHGFRGIEEAGELVKDNIDIKTGAPIYSLYGKISKPTPELLKGVDVLVFDIQDIGARFYTYISTMGRIMEAGAENNIPVYIFDRPNPIGRIAEGPIIEQEFYSGVGKYPIPIRHGLTVGELALMIKDKGWIESADKLDLTIVECKAWDPDKPYKAAKQSWINPSPNIRNINEALVYPGTCLFEATNFSEGRGSEKPFEWVGAPYVDSKELVAELKKRNIAGVEIEEVDFTPTCPPDAYYKPKYNDIPCHGVALTVTDPVNFKAVEFGIHFIDVLKDLYPDKFVITRPLWMHKLWGNKNAYDMFEANKSADEIIATYKQELAKFVEIREEYLLYR